MPAVAPRALLESALQSGRIHSAYLLSGAGESPRALAEWFVRALACAADPADGTDRPCEACAACRRSTPPEEPLAIDGAGKKGPLLRHVGDHPDLVWVERGEGDTRVRIGQIRALQEGFRLRGVEGGRRAAVVADAEWLNVEAQNALLRILEEPPPATTFVLVTRSPAGLLTTVRSRCVRVAFPVQRPIAPGDPEAPEPLRELTRRIEALPGAGIPGVLDWAEEFRGPRAITAAAASELLEGGAAWLHERAATRARAGAETGGTLGAFATLQACRKSLAQRNANPQMVVERALLALRDASAT